MIPTSCPLCQTAYKLPDDQAGKRVRCKSCAGTFVVGAPPDEEEAPVLEEASPQDLRTSSRRRRDEDDRPPRRRDKYEDDRPRRRDRSDEDEPAPGGGGVLLLVLGGGLAVLFLLGGAGALAYFFTRSSPPADAQAGGPVPADPGPGNPPAAPADQPPPAAPVVPPTPPAEKKLATVADALARLKDDNAFLRRAALEFLAKAPVEEDRRDEVGRALNGLLADRDVAEPAARAAGRWASKENLAKLIELLQEPNAPHWAAQVDALANYKDPRAYEAIARDLTVFGHGHHDKEALLRVGKDAEKAVVAYMHHESVFVRNDVAQLLDRWGTAAAVRRDQAVRDMEGKPESAEFALATLAKVAPDKESQPRVAAALVGLLGSKNGNVRREAVKCLAGWATADSVPGLIEALSDNELRLPAIGVLARLKDERAIGPLALHLSAPPRERELIVNALLGFGPKAEKAVQVQLTNGDAQLRRLACLLLAEVGTADSLPVLLQFARAERDRTNAATALAARKKIQARMKAKK
jgi:predicted Zn finger-like uncharacterized protein